ncbi:MAG: cytochrome b [Collimonas sp.]|uniref:cytochrome b n=1 Tax=Collimonas sp. TaxID=1963772 RepID=UPI003267F4D9
MNLASSNSLEKSPRYTSPAIFLHWMVAILIIGMIGLGWYMMSIEDEPDSGWLFQLHKSIGLLIVALVLLRLVWRFTHRPPALPQQVPEWQKKASEALHWLLYAAMAVMLMVGIAGALSSKHDLVFFGLPLPRLLAQNHDLSEIFFSIHSVCAWVLVVLISLHFLAALKHLIVNKDGLFQRMWFS